MKNLSLSVVVALCASILFSSCSKNGGLAITKRHYRGGYYVDMGGSKPQPATQQQRQVKAMPSLAATAVSSSEESKEVIPVESIQQPTPITYGRHEAAKHDRKKASSKQYASVQDQQTTVKEAQEADIKSYTSSLPDVDAAMQADSGGVPYWLMIVFCIILPPLAVGLKFGITMEFWIDLVLTLLFWIPGAIYALILIID